MIPYLRGRAEEGGPFPEKKRLLIGTAAHLPEHPQEPVIDRAKDTRHVDYRKGLRLVSFARSEQRG